MSVNTYNNYDMLTHFVLNAIKREVSSSKSFNIETKQAMYGCIELLPAFAIVEVRYTFIKWIAQKWYTLVYCLCM